MKTFKRRFQVLNVAAEDQAQVFLTEMQTLPELAQKIVDVSKSIVFDRAILFRNFAIVQGMVMKRIQYVDIDDFKRDFQVTVPFNRKVELPGLNPTVTIGRANRAIVSDNTILIGPNGFGTNDGFTVQLFLKQFNNVDELIPPLPSVNILEKIEFQFLIKISKFEQVDLSLPVQPVFDCSFATKCLVHC